MPIIPRYSSKVVPITRSPGLVTPGLEVGAAITTMGKTVVDIGTRFKKAEEVSQYNESMRKLREGLTDLRFAFTERQDFENFQEDFQKGVSVIAKGRFEEMKDNSLWGSFEAHMDGAIISTEVAVRTLGRNRQIDFGRASFTSAIGKAAEGYGRATEMEKQNLLVQVEEMTQLNAKAGYISQQEAQKALEEFRYKAMVSDAWTFAKIMDFEEGVSWLRDEKNTPELKRGDRNSLLAQLVRDWNAKTREQEKLEKEVEEARKRELAENDFAAWESFHKGMLTMSDLNSLASLRKISLKAYNGIAGKYKEEVSENDAVVVGELSESLELGIDIESDLADALEQGRIKTASYINLKRAMGVKDYKRGLYYINNSLKPTQFEAWNPDKFRRHADAVEEYNERVAEGGEPIEESREIVDLYLSDMRRTLGGLRRPRLLVGSKTDLKDLREAEEQTVFMFSIGELSPSQFEREIELINTLIELTSGISDKTSEIDIKKLERRIKKQEIK